jgi:NADPH:quinone reductase-like Zn-dependent oxidoreductase
MHGYIIKSHGGAKALQWNEDLPLPKPGHGEVRLRLKAVGMNHLDLWVRRGVPGHKFPLPLIPGSDMVGLVDEVGPGVKGIDPNQRYLVSPGYSCGKCPACFSGNQQLCRYYGIFGESTNGGYAQFVVVPEVNLIPVPDNLSWEEAASFPLATLTAWHMVVGRAQVRPGQWVLVQAAASGVSSAAIQICRFLGARVIATASTPEKLALAKRLGAEEVINYQTEDLVSRGREIAGRAGVDVIVDHVGGDTWHQNLSLLRPGGTLVFCGATTTPKVKLDLRPVFFRAYSILGSTMGSMPELRTVVDLMGQGLLKPTLDRALPLKQAPDAQILLEQRQVLGKLVLVHG